MSSNRYSGQILVKLEFSRHIFEISLNTQFHKNQSSENRVPWVQTDRDMTTVIVTYCCFANAPKQDKILQETRTKLPVHYLTLYLTFWRRNHFFF